MSNALAITLIGVGIFTIYLEQTGKINAVLGALKGGVGGEGYGSYSESTTTKAIPAFRGRYYVTPLGVLNVTDSGTY